MLIRDSKLYNMLLEEGRVVEPENYWELPKYTMKDFRAERMTKHWQNMLIRYPYTNEVSKFQINIGNLVSRMTNPTNYKVLGALNKEFVEFKDAYARLNKELRQLQYEYFLYTLEQVGQDCPDEVLSVSANKFFVQTYKEYSLLYKNLFDGFLEDIVKSGFGLSSLIFKHFASALTTKVPLERIGRK
ncbi:MAG: hypothetical protein NT033_03475 [Candidatus Omnitrophica bacterium]|nr:hypothetical protein [Candidatus Omnitrophota bacterium]